jgi:hypothetical protein
MTEKSSILNLPVTESPETTAAAVATAIEVASEVLTQHGVVFLHFADLRNLHRQASCLLAHEFEGLGNRSEMLMAEWIRRGLSLVAYTTLADATGGFDTVCLDVPGSMPPEQLRELDAKMLEMAQKAVNDILEEMTAKMHVALDLRSVVFTNSSDGADGHHLGIGAD